MRRISLASSFVYKGIRIFEFLLIFAGGLACRENFLESHWKRPLAEQGQPPSTFSELEKSLSPRDCGTCHKEQFEKWNGSPHSKATGPGLQWQLKRLGQEASQACFSCHSPLAETRSYWNRSAFGIANDLEPIQAYLKSGEEKNGILCASCHVRNHVRYGPPSRNSVPPSFYSAHGGYEVRNEFESSEFCVSCHDSPESGKKLNGKRMMETFQEWKQSRFAKEQITCQNCHMPNRSHEWKGIHDPETTRKAVSSSLDVRREGEEWRLTASLKNTGAGHKFPTYSVPKIFLTLSWVRNGKPFRILSEKTIGRVTDIDLEHEFEDTRLSPGEEVVLQERITHSAFKKGDEILFSAVVEPDEFYVRMFQWNADQKKEFQIGDDEAKHLDEALQKVKSTRYVLLEKRFKLPL
ncbi:cytochrome c554 and C-prime [Leptospira yasudae]|nr:cytochrome c554 and C-prime [Leptospira yasudae]TGM02751.1 cytochrome c554 and C-prime [Leptospira yasudae]